MISTKINISNDEVVLFQVEKKKNELVFMIFLNLMVVLGAMLYIVPCYKNIFLGAISFDSYNTYIWSIVSLLVIIPFALLFPLSYVFNKFVITDQRIYIRKGSSGILHIIDYNDINVYQHRCNTYRGKTIHNIDIYLKSGKRVSSGNLYLKDKNIPELIEVLNTKVNNITTAISRKQHQEMKQKNFEACHNEVRRNPIFIVISLVPFILAFIMLILYIAGVNKYGEQIDIQVYGRIESKSINHKKGKISGYEIVIIEEESEKKYEITTNEEIYGMFEVDDMILVKAKKGALGIVYNQWVYTQ